MSKFESSIKQINYPVEDVYRNISDLSNLERVRDRVPEDKLQDFQFDKDTVQVSVAPVGLIKLRIIEREENKTIKFALEGAPILANMWIQLLPATDTECAMKLTVKADLNFFIKQVIGSKLQQGVDGLAQMLASIPY